MSNAAGIWSRKSKRDSIDCIFGKRRRKKKKRERRRRDTYFHERRYFQK